MRQKELRVVLTFSTTTDAMAAEAHLKASKAEGRLIPIPREVKAGCGLAWSAPAPWKSELLNCLSEAGIVWEACQELLL